MIKNTLFLALAWLFFTASVFSQDLAPLVLPDDEGTHSFPIEWWYYTGHLQSNSPKGVRHFAFEMTVFQEAVTSPFNGYVAHFALIDLDAKQHHPFQRINPFASLLPPAPTKEGFNFSFDNGRWVVQGKDGHDHLKAISNGYGIDLDLHAIRAAVLYGDQGIVDYGVAGKLAYYSRTRMQTNGTVTVPNAQGGTDELQVTGLTWMDHQWGGDAGNPNKMGWDWFSVQLDNGVDLMMFHVRDNTSGGIVKTAAYIVSDNALVTSVPEEAISIQGSNPYQFGSAAYPMQYAIKIEPPFGLDLTIRARFPQQRFKVIGQITPTYWEGSSITIGTWHGAPVKGQGFTEMAGYE